MNSFHNFIIKKLNFIFKVKTTCGYYFSILCVYGFLVFLSFYIAGLISLSSKMTFEYFLNDFFDGETSEIFNNLSILELFSHFVSFFILLFVIFFSVIFIIVLFVHFLSVLPDYFEKIKAKFCRELTEEELSKLNK